MFFSDRPVVHISETTALEYLTRHIPYRTPNRRAAFEHELWKLSEAISIYGDFIPYSDRIKVEPLDEFYTFTNAVRLINSEFLKYLMLDAPGVQAYRHTIAAWLVLLSGNSKLIRVFKRCLKKTGISEINKEIVSLILDDGGGRTINDNRQIYKHIDLARDAMAKAAPSSVKLKVVLSKSNRGKRAIAAFKKDLPQFSSIYRQKGAGAVQKWTQSRSWFWYYSDARDINDRLSARGDLNSDTQAEWHWGYWL